MKMQFVWVINTIRPYQKVKVITILEVIWYWNLIAEWHYTRMASWPFTSVHIQIGIVRVEDISPVNGVVAEEGLRWFSIGKRLIYARRARSEGKRSVLSGRAPGDTAGFLSDPQTCLSLSLVARALSLHRLLKIERLARFGVEKQNLCYVWTHSYT